MNKTLHHYINGKRVSGKGRFGDVYNPATGEKAALVPFASKAEVEGAVAAAEAAFGAWSALPPLQRNPEDLESQLDRLLLKSFNMPSS